MLNETHGIICQQILSAMLTDLDTYSSLRLVLIKVPPEFDAAISIHSLVVSKKDWEYAVWPTYATNSLDVDITVPEQYEVKEKFKIIVQRQNWRVIETETGKYFQCRDLNNNWITPQEPSQADTH